MPPVRGAGCETGKGLVTSMGRVSTGTTGFSKGVAAAIAMDVRASGGEMKPGQRADLARATWEAMEIRWIIDSVMRIARRLL